jgi:hypothetical protein
MPETVEDVAGFTTAEVMTPQAAVMTSTTPYE